MHGEDALTNKTFVVSAIAFAVGVPVAHDESPNLASDEPKWNAVRNYMANFVR
jgi:hypothetical protein